MGLHKINVRGYQIETIILCGSVCGFKVHKRAFFPVPNATLNYEKIGEFKYFTEASRFLANEIFGTTKIVEKNYFIWLLGEIYAEGDDFRN